MEDRRMEILGNYPEYIAEVNDEENCPAISLDDAKSAMDEYSKEMCLALLEYMAKNGIECYTDKEGSSVFYMHDNYNAYQFTTAQLFENFL